MAQATIRLYILLSLIARFGSSFIMSTYVTFLIAHGLDLFEVNLVNLAFFITLFLCEVPTGAIADVFGRKVSYVCSCFLYAAGMLVYALSDSFGWFLVAESVSAVGATFASGAFQAWLVDRLKHYGYAGSLKPVFAKEQLAGTACSIVGAGAGAILADVNPALPWYAGSAVLAAGGIVAFSAIREEYFVRQPFSARRHAAACRETIRASARFSVRDSALRFVFCIGIMQFFAIQAPNMQWQPFFSQFLGSKTELGIVWAGMMCATMCGSLAAVRFSAFCGPERRGLLLAQFLIGAGIIATVVCRLIPAAFAFFLMHEAARGIFRPIKDAYLNDRIPSSERATLISFESLSHHFGGAIGLLLSGFLAERFSMQTAWLVSGAVLIVSTGFLARGGRKRQG